MRGTWTLTGRHISPRSPSPENPLPPTVLTRRTYADGNHVDRQQRCPKLKCLRELTAPKLSEIFRAASGRMVYEKSKVRTLLHAPQSLGARHEHPCVTICIVAYWLNVNMDMGMLAINTVLRIWPVLLGDQLTCLRMSFSGA